MKKFIKAMCGYANPVEKIINIDYICGLYMMYDEYYVDIVYDLLHFYRVSKEDYEALSKLKAGDINA